MSYDPSKHLRRSTRLKEWDYSTNGMYFITACVQRRLCLFGSVIDGCMILNSAGEMVENIWQEIPQHYSGIDIDEYVIMPNHFYGIIVIDHDDVGAPPRGRPLVESTGIEPPSETGQAQGPAPTKKRLSLGDAVGRFETLTMNRYIQGVKPRIGSSSQGNYGNAVIMTALSGTKTN